MDKLLIAIAAWYDFPYRTLEACYAQKWINTNVEIVPFEGYHAAMCRQKAIGYAQNTKADYILFVDGDNLLTDPLTAFKLHKTMLSLLDKGEDCSVISGVYYIRVTAKAAVPNFCIHDESINDIDFHSRCCNDIRLAPKDPFRADFFGFGCVLTNTYQLTHRINNPWFVWEHRGFEDVFFAKKAKEAGVNLWVDPSVVTGHLKRVNLCDVYDLVNGGGRKFGI